MDVSDPESIKKFASLVEKKHGAQSVQALINNAGINLDQEGFKVENTKRTLQTNYGGIVNVRIPVSASLRDCFYRALQTPSAAA